MSLTELTPKKSPMNDLPYFFFLCSREQSSPIQQTKTMEKPRPLRHTWKGAAQVKAS